MNKTVGSFLEQPNSDYPLDCELLDAMQTNTTLIGIIGNVAGDKAILRGCELENSDTQRKPGYVFVRTADYPDGEVLYFEGGAVSLGMYLKKEAVAVSAQGYDYPEAYTKRSLAPGVGDEQFRWADFAELTTLRELVAKNADQDAAITSLKQVPFGTVQLWAGNPADNMPEDYALCDGRTMAIIDYPELYAAIGRIHTPIGTDASLFSLPDLRSRFIVGFNTEDNDYNAIGNKGGEKYHTLKENEIPRHTHSVYGGELTGTGNISSTGFTYGRLSASTYRIYTQGTGGGYSHENRPPYYTLAYIMRVK